MTFVYAWLEMDEDNLLSKWRPITNNNVAQDFVCLADSSAKLSNSTAVQTAVVRFSDTKLFWKEIHKTEIQCGASKALVDNSFRPLAFTLGNRIFINIVNLNKNSVHLVWRYVIDVWLDVKIEFHFLIISPKFQSFPTHSLLLIKCISKSNASQAVIIMQLSLSINVGQCLSVGDIHRYKAILIMFSATVMYEYFIFVRRKR